jgi:hypothetical protein
MRKFFRKLWVTRKVFLQGWLFLFLMSFAAESPNPWYLNLLYCGLLLLFVTIFVIIFLPERTKSN